MELNINLFMLFSTYCWLANRFAIVQLLPESIENISAGFNMFLIDENNRINNISFIKTKSINFYFENFIKFTKIDVSAKNVCAYCIECLGKKEYCLIKVDKFYIKACAQYKKSHEYFEILIYGYDEEGFFFLNLNSQMKAWEKAKLKYGELEESYSKIIELESENKSFYQNLFEGNECKFLAAKNRYPVKVLWDQKKFSEDIYAIKTYIKGNKCILVDTMDINLFLSYVRLLIDSKNLLAKKIKKNNAKDADVHYESCHMLIEQYQKIIYKVLKYSINRKYDKEKMRADILYINNSESEFWLNLTI